MDEAHLIAAARYVAMNPVRARLVAHPRDWPWSSARADLTGENDGLVATRPLLERIGDFASLLAPDEDSWATGALRAAETTGRPLGNEAFIEGLERLLGRKLAAISEPIGSITCYFLEFISSVSVAISELINYGKAWRIEPMRSTNRKKLNTLGRWALDIQLKPMRDMEPLARPRSGWIKVIREALGMTTGQFAKRLGVAQPRVAALEHAEAEDAVTLKSLRHAAEALDCTLVYALVPNKPLEQMVSDRAAQLADRQLALTNQTMRLENQAVSRARMARARQELAKEILQDDRRLWAEP